MGMFLYPFLTWMSFANSITTTPQWIEGSSIGISYLKEQKAKHCKKVGYPMAYLNKG